MNSFALDKISSGRGSTKTRGTSYIFSCAVIVVILMGLVALRLYSFNLEYKLADIQRQIVVREEEQSRLEKDLASLLNPTRVYSYARSELGMRASANIGLVRVADSRENVVAGTSNDQAEVGKMRRALTRFVDILTGMASARQ